MLLKKINLIFFILILFFTNKSGAKKIILVNDDKEVVCFIYHRFGDSRYPTTNTSVKDFEKHLAYLQRNNFRILSFSDAIAYLKSDELSKKTAVITIDDGYRSFYLKGLPLLKKYKMASTLFINTQTVGGGDYMNWSELEIAMKNNVEIGNHTHSHAYFLNDKSTARYESFKSEIELSQSIIFKNLHVKPNVFSYPYGEFDEEMKTIVKEAGFIAAAAQKSGVVGAKTDFFQCPRFPMAEAYASEPKFIEKACTRPLNVVAESPTNSVMPANKKPILTLTFDGTALQLDRLQCFVQGGDCILNIVDKKKTTVTLMSSKPIIKRRRTLYTITVPDRTGAWHWYSHLWINTEVK